jgi:hypothetical protein
VLLDPGDCRVRAADLESADRLQVLALGCYGHAELLPQGGNIE